MALWIALAVCLVCLAVGVAVAARKGLAAWRLLKRSRAAFAEQLERIATASEGISVQLERAQESQERLAEARERLGRSRARLAVQLGAVSEARSSVDRLLWFLPGR